MTATTDSVIPTRCRTCDQPLLLLAEARDLCERCRLGRTELSAPTEQAVTPAAVPPVACRACGRTHTEDGPPLALADGLCLSCRVLGKHP